jgi:hypothetical protein
MKTMNPKSQPSKRRAAARQSKRTVPLRPLMRAPAGGRFTVEEIRAALKAIEQEQA